MADPVTLAIMAGLTIASYLLTPKPKTQAVDRGRLDDLRIQTAEEGAHIPIPFGRQVRLAGVIVDGEATREYITTTPGRSGGKGFGGGAGEGPVTSFGYKKTFAILGGLGPIKSFLQIKETNGAGTETIFDLRPSANDPSSIYEAEAAGNTLAGGALIVDDDTMSGGMRVSLPAGASVTFTGVRCNFTQVTLLTSFYVSDATGSLGVKVNAASESTNVLPSSGGVRASFDVLTTAVPAGDANTIRLKNLGANTISIDSIFFFAELPDLDTVTGVIDPGITYPSDLDRPNSFYNFAARPNGRGEVVGTFAAGGQSPFELYLGTEDQLQSPTLVALHGADHVSAMRGYWYIVANQYEVKGGALGNFTFTVEPMIQDLAAILSYLYLQTGQVDADDLDFSRVAGTLVEGMIYDRGDPINAYVDALALWYAFDIVPMGGKITAIPRDGASIVSIPEIDLFAREEGSEISHGALAVDHLNDLEISGAVDVLYSDISATKDFHTGKQHYSRELANTDDPDTVSVPIVSDADTAHAVAKRVVWEKILSAKPSDWATGPKYRYLLPTDVVTLTADDATYVHRIVSVQRAQSGLVKFKSVPEKGTLYDQVGAGIVGSGQELPPAAFPANTFLALMDIPPLRFEDDALGFYVAVASRGSGNWRGAILYKELVSGTYDRLTAFDRAATLGVVVGSVAAFSGDTTVFDRSTTITIDLYFDSGLLSSHTEAEILAHPLNLLVLGSGAEAEILQFVTATPVAATAPFVARYQLSTLLRGRGMTENGARAGHSAGKAAVFLNDDLKFRNEDPNELRAVRNYKAVTVGQALDDAPVAAFTFEGYSKKPPGPGLRGSRSSANDLFIELTRRGRLAPGIRPGADVPLSEEIEQYIVEIPDATPPRSWPVITGMGLAALLEGSGATKFTDIDMNIMSSTNTGFRARSLQEITETGNYVDAVLSIPAGGASGEYAGIGLIQSSRDWKLNTGADLGMLADYFVKFNLNIVSGQYRLIFFKDDVNLLTINLGTTNPSPLRMRVILSGSEVRFVRDWAGPGSPATYVSPVPASFPMKAVAMVAGNGADEASVEVNMTINPQPATIYSAAQQTEDGLTPGDPVRVRGYQVSALVGRGPYTEVTL